MIEPDSAEAIATGAAQTATTGDLESLCDLLREAIGACDYAAEDYAERADYEETLGGLGEAIAGSLDEGWAPRVAVDLDTGAELGWRIGVTVEGENEKRPDLATIAFQPEAHDSAADRFRGLRGLTVTVVPTEGEQFDAQVHGLRLDDDGQYRLDVRPWDEERGEPTNEVRTLDIYDELERIEVI